MEPHQTGGAGAVGLSTRGASRHCRDDLDVTDVPHIQRRRRLEQNERVRLPRPQDIRQAPSASSEQQIWAESETGRLTGAVMDPPGSFVVTCVPWFGLASGESGGQSGDETIHGTVLRGFGLGGSHCPLLRVRPYKKPTRIWSNMMWWIPMGRTWQGQCLGEGLCSQLVGTRHLNSAARSGRRVGGKGSVAGKSAVLDKLVRELVEAVEWRVGSGRLVRL